MTSEQGEPEFNQTRAELFEALGHPIRIRMLQTLERGSLGFADLKKAVGIESSGHLAFHLGKLEGLLRAGPDGTYSLTDEGREALRVVAVTSNEGNGGIRVNASRLGRKNVTIVALVIGVLLLSSFVVYQQQQIGGLNSSILSQQVGTVLINGTRYSYLDIPLQSLNLPTTVYFNGVSFNLTALPSGVVTVTRVGTAQQGSGTPIYFSVSPVMVNVQVRFADGQIETWAGGSASLKQATTIFNLTNSTGTTSGIVFTFQLGPTTNPWFTHHTNPRAGAYWNSANDTLRLMVGMGA